MHGLRTNSAATAWRGLSSAAQQPERVGVIGLGKIGQAMARNWLADGQTLIVYDTDTSASARLANGSNAVEVASSAGDVAARASTLVTVLPNDKVLTQVCLQYLRDLSIQTEAHVA